METMIYRRIGRQHAKAKFSTVGGSIEVLDTATGKILSIEDSAGRCRYEIPMHTVAPLIGKEYKYAIDTAYLLGNADKYGIDRDSMYKLISDYFGFVAEAKAVAENEEN